MIRAGSLAALLALAGCAGVPARDPAAVQTAPASASAVSPRAQPTPGGRIARVATEMIGIPYRYGGSDPREGFDCSGLVYYTYAHAGIAVPRTSADLFKATRKIALERAAEGDLVFFQDQAKMSHVGIYLGDSLFVHAPSSGSTVRISSLETPYYRRHLVAVGRLLP